MVPFKMYLCKSLVESPRAVKYLILTWISIYWEPPHRISSVKPPEPTHLLGPRRQRGASLVEKSGGSQGEQLLVTLGFNTMFIYFYTKLSIWDCQRIRIKITKGFRIGIAKELG